MSALGISWNDKEFGGNPQVDRPKQWWYQDANEVKDAVNNHRDLLDQFGFTSPTLDGKVAVGQSTSGLAKFTIKNDALTGSAFTILDDANAVNFDFSELGSMNVAKGDIGFSSSQRQYLNLSSASYGIGKQDNTQYFRTATGENFAWYLGGSHNDGELNAGGGALGMALVNGDLGIGESPTAKLTAKATALGQKLLEVKTFGGDVTLQADDAGSVWNSGVTGNNENTHFGFQSGLNNTGNPGTRQTTVGFFAGRSNTGAFSNGLGAFSLQNNTGVSSNGFGYFSLANNTGSNSCGFGFGSLQNNNGGASSGFGNSSLSNNTGANSSGFGFNSLSNNSGNNSSGFGFQSLLNNQGNGSTALGYEAGFELDILLGPNNTFLGANASYGTNVNISNATAVGANITLEQSNSVILGDNADVGIGTTTPTAKLEVQNTAPGQKLLELKTFGGETTLQADDNGNVWNTGAGNDIISTAYGFRSAQGNTGAEPTAYGFGSLQGNSGDFCSGVGVDCLFGNQGDNCSSLGRNALKSNQGDNTTAIGAFSGFVFGLTLTGSNNTFLGGNSTYSVGSISNATAVGANITLSQSNSVVLGDNNVTDIFGGGDGAGLNLKSPNGTNYRISVDNSGSLIIT